MDRDRGDTGREPPTTWVTTDSLLGDVVTETEVLLVGEEVIVCMLVDLDWPIEEGVRLMLVGVVSFAAIAEKRQE